MAYTPDEGSSNDKCLGAPKLDDRRVSWMGRVRLKLGARGGIGSIGVKESGMMPGEEKGPTDEEVRRVIVVPGGCGLSTFSTVKILMCVASFFREIVRSTTAK